MLVTERRCAINCTSVYLVMFGIFCFTFGMQSFSFIFIRNKHALIGLERRNTKILQSVVFSIGSKLFGVLKNPKVRERQCAINCTSVYLLMFRVFCFTLGMQSFSFIFILRRTPFLSFFKLLLLNTGKGTQTLQYKNQKQQWRPTPWRRGIKPCKSQLSRLRCDSV